MPTGIWKVRGEEKYFKKLNGKDWGEFAYGRQVFSFKFVKNDGDDVVLVKTDGSYLKLTSSQLLMGWGEDDYSKYHLIFISFFNKHLIYHTIRSNGILWFMG